MANTCSFFKSNERHKNKNCFASLRQRNSYGFEYEYLIIEKDKSKFSKELTEEYLDDICNLFNVKYEYVDDEYRIYTYPIGNILNRTLFFMIIRFLWENDNTDKFIQVVEHYFYLKNNFTDIDDVLKRICIACNCFLSIRYNYLHFNANHFLCSIYTSENYNSGNLLSSCKIISYEEFNDLVPKYSMVNSIFKELNKATPVLFGNYNKESFNKECYLKILNKLYYE